MLHVDLQANQLSFIEVVLLYYFFRVEGTTQSYYRTESRLISSSGMRISSSLLTVYSEMNNFLTKTEIWTVLITKQYGDQNQNVQSPFESKFLREVKSDKYASRLKGSRNRAQTKRFRSEAQLRVQQLTRISIITWNE